MRIMKSDYKQLIILSCIVLSTTTLYLIAPSATYPYIGLVIAFAGISIGCQQLYIYSQLGKLLIMARREFYLASSFSLLVLGSSIFSHSATLLILRFGKHKLYSLNYDELSPLILFLYKSAFFLGCCAVFFMANLVISFLYQPLSQSNPVGGLIGQKSKKTKRLYFFNGERSLLEETEALSPREKKFVKILWFPMMISIYLELLLVGGDLIAHLCQWMNWFNPLIWLNFELFFKRELSENYSFFLEPGSFYFLSYVSILFCMAIAGFLIQRRLLDLLKGKVEIEAFTIFFIFMALFSFPPFFQTVLNELNDLIWSCAIFVGCFLLGIATSLWLRRQNKALFNKAFPRKDERLRKFYWSVFNLAVILVPLLGLIGSVYLHTSNLNDSLGNSPFSFISFAFLALGCAWLAAVDLGVAGKSYNSKLDASHLDFFITQIRHELLNPLKPVQMFMNSPELKQLLNTPQEASSIEEGRQKLHEFHPAVTSSLGRAINLILSIKKQKAIKPTEFPHLNLSVFARDFVREYNQFIPKQLKKRVEVSYCHDRDEIPVRIDKNALISVLRIFLDNAVEATDNEQNNTIRVTTRVQKPERRVQVRIEDTGQGMPDEVRKNFGFLQTSTKPGGSGVGTLTAQGLLSKMRGRVSIEYSTPGQGTGILIELPLEPLEERK